MTCHDPSRKEAEENAIDRLASNTKNGGVTVGVDRLFQVLIEAVSDYAIYMLDVDGTIVTWNVGATRRKGYTSKEILGKNYSCFFTPEDIALGVPSYQLAEARTRGHYSTQGWRLRKDGSPFWAGISLTAIYSPEKGLQGFARVTQDLTEVKAREEALRASEATLQQEKERLRVTLQSIAEGVISTDEAGRAVLMNPAAERMTGWPFEEAEHKSVGDIMRVVAQTELASNPFMGALDGRKVDLLLESASGERRVIECSTGLIRQPDGSMIGAVTVFDDVTSQRASLEHLEFHATHDHPTGLLNRREFEARVAAAVKQGAGRCQIHSLCFIDLDRFKEVNDTAGHGIGDALLKEMASIMTSHVRQTDVVARLGEWRSTCSPYSSVREQWIA